MKARIGQKYPSIVVGDAGLVVGEGFETFFYRCAHQSFPLADEGHIFLAYGLEMEVVGGRSTAFGSVVEYGITAGKCFSSQSTRRSGNRREVLSANVCHW